MGPPAQGLLATKDTRPGEETFFPRADYNSLVTSCMRRRTLAGPRWAYLATLVVLGFVSARYPSTVQGYLAHKKTHPPKTLP